MARNILVLKETSEENNQKLLDAIGGEYQIQFSVRGREDYRNKLKEAEVIIGEPSIEDLKNAEKLKWLQMTWAGTDIYTKSSDFPKNVILTNMSGVFGETISEYVIGAILTLYRSFPIYFRNQEKKIWKDMGSEKTLFGKTVLLLGAGDIGTSIAKRLRPFGTKNIGVRRTVRGMESCFDAMHTLKDVEALLSVADIVIGCLPDTTETENLLNRERLLKMKPDAVLVNVGRGSLIVTKDLEEVLEAGHLFGVALDVMKPEPLPKESKLWDMENVIITPHISGQGFGHEVRTEQKIYDVLSENIRRYIRREPLLNVVDLERGYRVEEERYQ